MTACFLWWVLPTWITSILTLKLETLKLDNQWAMVSTLILNSLCCVAERDFVHALKDEKSWIPHTSSNNWRNLNSFFHFSMIFYEYFYLAFWANFFSLRVLQFFLMIKIFLKFFMEFSKIVHFLWIPLNFCKNAKIWSLWFSKNKFLLF